MDESRRNGDDEVNKNHHSNSNHNSQHHDGDELNPVMDTLHQSHSLSARTSSALANDARLEFISSYTLTTLRLKQDKWLKMMATPEYQIVLLDWLNNSQRRILVMTLNPGGLLIPKSSISDLYHNYAVHVTTKNSATTIGATSPTAEEVRPGAVEASTSTFSTTTTAAATLAASVAMTPLAATVMLAPLPPPSSSFSTLDGVPRGKCAFFLRSQLNVALVAGRVAFSTQVICGDFPVHSKIDTLLILFDEILQPLLQNPQNRRLWPDVVGKDLNSRMKDVRNTLTEIKGKTNNRTILSLLVSPTVIEEIASHIKQQGNMEAALDAKFRGQLEEMVINWTSQVHEIITEKSDCIAHNPKSRGTSLRVVAVSMPAQEVNFWLNRQQNLENLYGQLRSSTYRSVAYILEELDSPYYRPFANMLKNVVCAWHEAQDVSLWLQPLLRQTAAFNAVSFANAQELIMPLVHVVHLLWSNARHYRTTARMTVLLRCICNLMIRRANEDLELATLFQSDADEGLSKITKTMGILEMFKWKLLEYKAKYTSNQTILPALPVVPLSPIGEPTDRPLSTGEVHQLWRFSNEDVFGHALDGFLDQLAEIQTVFEAAVSFQSLEKMEIGGCIGKFLTERIRQIHADFKMLFEEWTKLEIDLSHTSSTHKNSSWQTFRREQAMFFQHMEVLEKKLATILLQAFGDCHNWEQLTKLTTMFANIVQRQTIQSELRVILPHILRVYDDELLLIEGIVSEVLLAFEYRGVEAILLERSNFPPMAGAMMCLENYMRRCDVFGAHELNALIKVLIAGNPLSPQYEKLTARRNILTTKLSNLQLKVWHNWQQTIEKRIARGLDTKLMTLHHNSGSDKIDTRRGHSHTSHRRDSTNKFDTTWRPSNHPRSRCHIVSTTAAAASAATAVLSESSPGDDTKILQMNFSIELFTLLRETKYLLALQQLYSRRSKVAGPPCDSSQTHLSQQLQHNHHHHHHPSLPQTLLDLYAQRDVFWQRKIRLMQIAEYYNTIREGLTACIEMQLIHPSVSDIDEHLDLAANTMTWRQYDAEIVDEIHRKTQALHHHLAKARSNVQQILDSIRRWSREPLHQRSIYGKNLLEIRHQQQRLRTRILQCEETKLLLNRLLATNFRLFFNYEQEPGQKCGQDENIHEFLRNFPEEQRDKFNRYLEFIDQMIYDEVRQSMQIRLRQNH